jgi:tetratricopeptide (TPR) repeat protein
LPHRRWESRQPYSRIDCITAPTAPADVLDLFEPVRLYRRGQIYAANHFDIAPELAPRTTGIRAVSASADLALMRASLLLESDPAAAARQAGDILASWPGNEEANLLLANAYRRLGDAAAACRLLECLTQARADSAVIQLELGRAYAADGRGSEALTALQRAVDLDGALTDAWREIAALRFHAGDISGGDAAYLRFSRLAADPVELTDVNVAISAGRLQAAESQLRQHLRRSPEDVAALRLLADVAAQRGDHVETERCLASCLALAPGDAKARHELARLLYRQERIGEMLPMVERLLATDPRNTSYLTLKAQGMRLVGRAAESIALMEAVVADFPTDVRAWVVYGNLMREIGDQPRSIESFRRALVVQPSFGEAYWALANLKTFRFATSDVESMQGQLASDSIADSSRIHFEFALGKALEDAGNFAASFEHYSRGAALQRATLAYDADATSDFVQRANAMFKPQFFADRAAWGSPRRDPIFIVGLPRSGSTLLEQILASHSQVEGTRELPDVPAIVEELAAHDTPGGELRYPEPIAALSRGQIEAIAARYLADTQVRRPLGRPRFVDKMLGNFSHIGLVHLMFPHATIIDARRHPLGCGFSCYKQLFAQGMNYSYDLGELGRYYKDYAELMAHIDAVLPGRVYRVYYEQMVADPEREVRRLLDRCGLEFEPQCLRFYENPRAVQTISSEQVRRPIYSDAVDHWRHYQAWLGPLRDAMGEVCERYPTEVPLGKK